MHLVLVGTSHHHAPVELRERLAFDAAGNLYATASNAGEILQIGPSGGILQRKQ